MTSRVTAASALLTALAALAGCQPQNAFVPPPPPAVTVAQPLRRDVVDYLQTTGETRAVDRVELRAQVSGYLKEINFKDGELVEKGRLLFRVDPHRYQAAVNSAKATLLKAEAALKLANAQLGRARALVERNAATREQLDEAEAQKASAEADVASARSAISRAELDLAFTEIRAPFAGRMGRHEIDVGNLVEVGTTRLAVLESFDPIHAYFNLSEQELLRFRQAPGASLLPKLEGDDGTAAGHEIEIAIGDGGEFEFKGRLDFQEFGVDPATGTTMRRAVLDNPDARLVPGLFVRVRAATGPPRPKLLVEERAISSDQRGDFLLVVTEKPPEQAPADGPAPQGETAAPDAKPAAPPAAGGEAAEPKDRYVVEYRNVKLGRSDGGLRVVEQGLEGGEWIIVNGLQRARPGAEVVPERAEMAPPAAGPPVAFRVLPPDTTVAERDVPDTQ